MGRSGRRGDYSDSSRSPRRGGSKSRRERRRRSWSSSASSSSSLSSRSSGSKGRGRVRSPRRSRSKDHSKSPKKSKSKQRSRSPRRSRSKQRSRSPRRNRSKPRSKSSDRRYSSRSPRSKQSSNKNRKSGRGGRSSTSRSPRPNRSALKNRKAERGRNDSDFSTRSVRSKKKGSGLGKHSDSEFSSHSIKNKAKRVPRRNSPGTGSDRSVRDHRESGKNNGFGRNRGAYKKRNPRNSRPSSEDDGNKSPPKRHPKNKKLSRMSKLSRSKNKRDSWSSDNSGGSKYNGRQIRKPWRAAKDSSEFRAPRSKKKGNAKFKDSWDRSEDDRGDNFRVKMDNSFGDYHDKNRGRPLRGKKAVTMSDGPPRGMNLRKKKANHLSQIRQVPKKQKNAPLANPQRPIIKQPLVQEKMKPQEKAYDSEIARIRLQVKKLQDEVSAVKKSPPTPPPDTVTINKRKLEGLIDGTILKDAGGVENAIASLVNKRQDLEGQLVKLKNELQKKNDVEKNLESMKDELQRNLERIEKNSQGMSPNGSKSDDTIYNLSQRIAAVEQEHREMRHKDMMRYPMSSVANPTHPLYYQSPTPMQPVVHIHPSTPYKPYQRHYHTGRDVMYQKPTHYSPSPGEPPVPHNSQFDRYSEGSFAEYGDIAELCSALAATVDLVKKVINVDA